MTQAAPSRSAGDGAPPEPPSPPEPPAGARRRRDRLFPGDRRVWLTAAVVLAIGLVVVAVEVLTPRDFYTGTNSIRTRSFSTTLKRGDQLCVPRQSIPAGTGRIEMEVNSAQGAKSLPAQSAELRIAGRTIPLSDVPGGGPVGPRKITFALPGKRPRSPDSVPGTVCVRSAGGVTYGGMAALQGNDVPSTINGRPNLNRVAIWYLPPRGEKRSLLSQLPAVLARASLFRPGVVGPWTYAVLLLVWLPLLGYGALRLLATAAERNPRRVALLVALLAFGNAAAWAIVTPAFNAPDESEHFAYVQWFAETGKTVARAPDPNRPIYSSQETLALDATRIFSNNEAADGRPPWLKLDERRLAQRTQAAYHGHPRQDNGGGNTAATQAHSPVYYGLLAPAYLVTRSGSTWTQLTAVRLLSALFGAVVAMCAFLLVRELVPRHPVPAVAAGLLVGFQPMFAFISGAVNNDNGVNALAAIVVFLVVRGLRRGLTWRTGLALGVALVVLPLMKATGYELYPLSFLALVPMLWRHHRRADLIGFAALAGAFLVAYLGWHAISPSFESASAATVTAGSASVGGARDNLPGYLSYLWQIFLPPLPFMTDLQSFPAPYFHIYVERGFGAFGWYAVLFPDWVYQVIRVALLVSGAAGIAALWRNRAWVRRHLVEIAYVALVPVSVIAAVHAAYFTTEQRTVIPEFGRYAFPAMAALAAMAVGSTFALGRRRVVPLATGLVALMLVLNYAAQLLTLTGFYT